ncbi:MAG TPA: class I SAM-dependent rRNA methyltransferase [Bryobacteraceae bacterium]|nr:class I SAM-dependent rRNA methyltransferase [Bryobacteraceae bacterium]
MSDLPVVRISRKGADRILSGHPWIFSSDVIDRGKATPGAAVAVVDHRGKPLGTAHFSSASQICLRFLSHSVEPAGREFFRRRIEAAETHRKRVVKESDAYRLVHGEGDLLPALIIDRYADTFVIQTLDQGMDRAKADIAAVLQESFSPRAIIERNDAAVRKREDLPLVSGVLAGQDPGAVPIQMNGLRLQADLLHGQKTGVYLDQRENYLAARNHARGRALDCFTSTGGFALHIARCCERVEGIDSSAVALETAAQNASENSIANVEWREANVFDFLTGLRLASARRFSTIVLDPPAFAKSRSAIEDAARGYKELNLRAMQLLEPGGVLITCSCSHHFSEPMFADTVAAAAVDTGRTVRVLERRTQAQDHPILLTVPETMYLKCFILQVL